MGANAHWINFSLNNGFWNNDTECWILVKCQNFVQFWYLLKVEFSLNVELLLNTEFLLNIDWIFVDYAILVEYWISINYWVFVECYIFVEYWIFLEVWPFAECWNQLSFKKLSLIVVFSLYWILLYLACHRRLTRDSYNARKDCKYYWHFRSFLTNQAEF